MSPFGRWLVALVAGAVVGAAAFAGWWILSGSDTVTVAEQPEVTTSIVEVEAPWREGGVRYETTVIVPLVLTVEGGTAELEYLAETISPALDRHGDDEPGTPVDVLFQPEHWLLEMEGDGPVEATTPADADRVLFVVPDAATVEDVLAVHVTGWRRALLVGGAVTLALERGAAGTLHDGTELVMETVLDQSTSTIIQVAVEEPDDLWHAEGGFGYRSPDTRWRLSGGFGGGGFQMTWEGDDAPGEVTLVQHYPEWVPVAERVTIIGGDAA
jgi:hypothetical protein